MNYIWSADRPASCRKNLLAALRGDNSHFNKHRHLWRARPNSLSSYFSFSYLCSNKFIILLLLMVTYMCVCVLNEILLLLLQVCESLFPSRGCVAPVWERRRGVGQRRMRYNWIEVWSWSWWWWFDPDNDDDGHGDDYGGDDPNPDYYGVPIVYCRNILIMMMIKMMMLKMSTWLTNRIKMNNIFSLLEHIAISSWLKLPPRQVPGGASPPPSGLWVTGKILERGRSNAIWQTAG